MGYSTDFVGHIVIDPPLNEEETDYLVAFTSMRHWDRPGGPFVVPDHPLEPGEPRVADRYNRVPRGKPGLWCPWSPCLEGHCLAFDGTERAYEAGPWLAYLIETFLAPAATAAQTSLPALAGFTFDHRCDGVVAASRRDSGELSLLVVTGNVLETLVVVPGVPDGLPWGGLPYQVAADRAGQARQARQVAWRRRLAQLRPPAT